MKKLLFIAIFGLGIAKTTAQVTYSPGVKAGLNLSKFTNADASYKTDFYLGGQLGINFTKFYTLQPEVVYSRQGATIRAYEIYYPDYDPVITDTTKDVKYSLDYISLGVFNKFNFKGFYVGAGPSLDFLITDNFEENGADDPIGFDLALLLGAGYAFPNGLTVEARFKQGLTDIFGNNYNTYYEDENGNYDDVILNQSFQIGLSYTFDFK